MPNCLARLFERYLLVAFGTFWFLPVMCYLNKSDVFVGQNWLYLFCQTAMFSSMPFVVCVALSDLFRFAARRPATSMGKHLSVAAVGAGLGTVVCLSIAAMMAPFDISVDGYSWGPDSIAKLQERINQSRSREGLTKVDLAAVYNRATMLRAGEYFLAMFPDVPMRVAVICLFIFFIAEQIKKRNPHSPAATVETQT